LAEKAGISVEELVANKVAELGEVTDEETLAFYEENKGRLGTAEYDALKDQIRDFLTSQREGAARSQLKAGGDVVVFLEPPRVEVAPEGPSKGADDAPITIVEFSDFQCPYCKRVIPTLQEVMERYPDQVRLVFRNFPLGNHSRAKPAATAALCADRQDKFWAYHDRLFENARELSDEDLKRYATELELDIAAFEACLSDEAIAKQIEADFADGRAAGVTGTPAFFVNGVLLSGAKPSAAFFRTIDAELARLNKGG
jgi:protein-disulfide isomerase